MQVLAEPALPPPSGNPRDPCRLNAGMVHIAGVVTSYEGVGRLCMSCMFGSCGLFLDFLNMRTISATALLLKHSLKRRICAHCTRVR